MKNKVTCQNNNNEVCEYCKVVGAQDGWKFKGCFCKPYKGKWVAEIKECPLIIPKECQEKCDELNK